MSANTSMAELRTAARVGARTARRAAVGAWSLGPVAFAQAVAATRRTTGDVRNTGLTWVDAGARNTIVWIHEYWNDAYGIDPPIVNLTLLDAAGVPVAGWTAPLPRAGTHGVDVRAVCRAHDVPLPFTGQLLAEIRGDGLVAGRPLQVLAEYRDVDGSGTLVHGQYGVSPRPLAHEIGAMRVDPDAVMQQLSVVNGLVSSRAVEIQPRLTLRNHAGVTRRARLPRVPAHGSILVDLHEIVPDLGPFLEGRPGQVSVRVPYPASRIASCATYADGRRIVNHGTIDRVFDQARGVPGHWTESWPVVSMPFHAPAPADPTGATDAAGQVDTVYTIPNRVGPVRGVQRVLFRVHTRDGDHVANATFAVASDATLEVRASAIAEHLGLELPFDGHVELASRLLDDDAEQPGILDVVVAFERDGVRIGEALAGGAFFNAPVPPRLAMPDVRRTRTFGLVRAGGGSRTHLFLANPAGRHGYDVTAEPTLRLFDTQGTPVAETSLRLAPHAGRWFDVDDLFPGAAELLGSEGTGTVRVRDTEARVYGWFVVGDRGRTVMFDHLVGG